MYETSDPKATRCPTCGQFVRSMRLGVALFPQGARIFDLIKEAGRDGITSEDLWTAAYRGMRKPQRRTLNGHVCQLRTALASTGYTISCTQQKRVWVYKLVKCLKLPGYGTVATCVSDGDGGPPVAPKR